MYVLYCMKNHCFDQQLQYGSTLIIFSMLSNYPERVFGWDIHWMQSRVIIVREQGCRSNMLDTQFDCYSIKDQHGERRLCRYFQNDIILKPNPFREIIDIHDFVRCGLRVKSWMVKVTILRYLLSDIMSWYELSQGIIPRTSIFNERCTYLHR